MNATSDSDIPPKPGATSRGTPNVGRWLALMLVSSAGILGRNRVTTWLLSGEQIGPSGAAFFSWALFILSCAGLAWGLKHSRSLAQSLIVQVISHFLLAWMSLGIRLIESVLNAFPPTRACVRFTRETGTPALRQAIELVGKACCRIPANWNRWLVIVLTLSSALVASATSGVRRVLKALLEVIVPILSVFAFTLGTLRTPMTRVGRALLCSLAMAYRGLRLVLSACLHVLRFCGNLVASLIRPVSRLMTIGLGFLSRAAISAIGHIARGILLVFASTLRLLGNGLTRVGRSLLRFVTLAVRRLGLVLSFGFELLRSCGKLTESFLRPVLQSITSVLGSSSRAAISAVRIIARGIARVFAFTLPILGKGLTTSAHAVLRSLALAFRTLMFVLSLGLRFLRFCGNRAASLLRPVLRSITFALKSLCQAAISGIRIMAHVVAVAAGFAAQVLVPILRGFGRLLALIGWALCEGGAAVAHMLMPVVRDAKTTFTLAARAWALITAVRQRIAEAMWSAASAVWKFAIWPLEHPGQMPEVSIRVGRKSVYAGFAVLYLLGSVIVIKAVPLTLFASDSIPITIASSSTKKEWLDQAVESFNAAAKSDAGLQVNGKPVFVEVVLEEIEPGKKDHYRSGSMVTDILTGKIKPTIASPAELSWIMKLNNEWQAANAKPISSGEAPALARTPLVLAMWESRARALDCWPSPKPQCTWERIRALATLPDGWKMFGRADWGKFKLGYGYVGESNSGTLTAAILCMRGLAKTRDLARGDVSATNGCGQMIAAVERAKVHSGKKSSWLLDRMRTGGPEYLDAITSYEQEVIEFNKNQSGLREPMVAVYPQDGTVVVTHPFAILDGTSWVSPDQMKAAEIFRIFLLSNGQQSLLLKYGLRPANPQTSLGPPLETAYGANPAAKLLTVEMPDSLVFDRIRAVWHDVKKHASIAIVFDKSGSMAGDKISYAIEGAQAFASAMDPKDWLAWLVFDNHISCSIQGLKSETGEKLVSDIRSTTAGSGTALYDAVAEAFDMVEHQRRTLGDSVRYGIVILSDGKDTNSRKATLALLEAKLKPSERDATGIQIHTIGIGTDADDAVLRKIANMAHGKYWKVKNPADVVEVYKEIATHY